jgi:hypothetical protein
MSIGEYYMVTDEVWPEADCGLESGWGMVCIGCLEERLGRELTAEDFTGAPINWSDVLVIRGERMIDRTERE